MLQTSDWHRFPSKISGVSVVIATNRMSAPQYGTLIFMYFPFTLNFHSTIDRSLEMTDTCKVKYLLLIILNISPFIKAVMLWSDKNCILIAPSHPVVRVGSWLRNSNYACAMSTWFDIKFFRVPYNNKSYRIDNQYRCTDTPPAWECGVYIECLFLDTTLKYFIFFVLIVRSTSKRFR